MQNVDNSKNIPNQAANVKKITSRRLSGNQNDLLSFPEDWNHGVRYSAARRKANRVKYVYFVAKVWRPEEGAEEEEKQEEREEEAVRERDQVSEEKREKEREENERQARKFATRLDATRLNARTRRGGGRKGDGH